MARLLELTGAAVIADGSQRAPGGLQPLPLDPADVDDLPPATLISSIKVEGAKRSMRGVSRDNSAIATVSVNEQSAKITARAADVADWTITLDAPAEGRYLATATDVAGNGELMPHDHRERAER